MFWIVLGFGGVAVAGGWLAWRWFQGCSAGASAEAELPCGFGSRMAWVAVRTRDTARLIEALRLHDARSVPWSAGVSTIYSERAGLSRVFVTPPVDGWSFVAGLSLPHPMGEAFQDRCTPILAELSQEFGQVQYYISYPELSYFGWAVLRNGSIARAFACGREGVVWNKGRVSADERAFELPLFDIREARDEGEAMPALREQHVFDLARRWSLDPTELSARDDLEVGVGYVATAPAGWKTAPATEIAA